jgi:hypothetical protein
MTEQWDLLADWLGFRSGLELIGLLGFTIVVGLLISIRNLLQSIRGFLAYEHGFKHGLIGRGTARLDSEENY